MIRESLIKRLKKESFLNVNMHSDAWRIHFRHLSCTESHQLAFEPFIDFRKDEGHDIWESCMIMVWEERISVEFFDFRGPDESRRMAAVIIDWTTGQILLVSVTHNVLLNRLLKKT